MGIRALSNLFKSTGIRKYYVRVHIFVRYWRVAHGKIDRFFAQLSHFLLRFPSLRCFDECHSLLDGGILLQVSNSKLPTYLCE